MIEKKTGKMPKRNLTKGRSMKPRPLLLNPERKYKYLCEEGSAVMMMLGADGKVIDANTALLEMSGYSRHEVVGKNALDFVVPEQRKKTAAQIQTALIDGAASEFEVAFRSKDGSTRTLLLPPKQLALDEEGQRSFLVMGVDITERDKYETRLQALHTHASQLSSAEEIDAIVKCTLDAMEFVLGFEHADILLVENDSLQIKGSRGRPEAFSTQPLGGRGTTVKAATTKTTLRISDTRKEPAFVDPEGYDWTGPPTVLSELVVPVLIDADTVAVLCVDSVRLDAFSDDDQKLLETLAIHVGSALGRTRSVEALRVSEERFRQVMEATSDGLWDWNVETGTIYYSPAYYQILGYEPDEFPGLAQSWTDLIHPDERDGVLRSNQDCIENRIPNFKIEFRMRTKSGGWKWILGRGRASARDVNGRALRMIGTHQDITERKQMEEELRRSSQFMESIIENANVWLDVLDEENSVVVWNKAAEMMSGYSKGDVVGHRKIWEWLYPDLSYRKQITDSVNDILQHGRAEQDVETNIRRKDGQSRVISWNERNLLGKHGKVIGSIAIGRDVTEQKQMREDLERYSKHLEELVEERTEKLRQAERLATIGETAAMVGHDLRNPLQGIAGALHLLRQESLTTNERDEMLQLIQRSVEYADAVVRDLSEYSAEIILELTDTMPKSLTREAMRAVKVPPTISVQDLSQNHPTLKVDTGRIKRVLVNLIENAIDAMPQGGTLTINSRLWNDTVEIALSDTGSGMPEKVMENLWKPLQTTKAKGLGLGLAICKRIVDAHGGTISVKSKAGEGTTVTIGLPIKPVGVEVKRK